MTKALKRMSLSFFFWKSEKEVPMINLITHGYVITVNKSFAIYKDGAVAYEGDRILDIGDSEDLEKKYEGAKRFDAKGMAVMPGLINTHLHSGLIRGTAEDMPVFEWLALHVDPAHKVLTADDAEIASKVCYSESLLAGTTTVVDMYRYMHRCADSAEETGIRAIMAPYVGDRPGYDYFEKIDDNEILFKERNNSADGRVKVWFGLEHIAYCSEDAYRRVAKLAEKYDTGIHTHGEESITMVNMIKKKYGCDPIKLFYDRGILGPKTLIAHCCWINPYEIEILRATGTSIAHCPISNMKLASGICPVTDSLRAGVAVGVASDGIKENNSVDLFEEMKFASLLQKLGRLDASVMTAEETIKLATIYGARAVGMEDEIGSLEIGKKADIIMVDLRKLHLSPYLTNDYANIVANLAFSANGADVDTVIVNGDTRVLHRKLLTEDIDALMERYTAATEALIERRRPYVPESVSINNIEL